MMKQNHPYNEDKGHSCSFKALPITGGLSSVGKKMVALPEPQPEEPQQKQLLKRRSLLLQHHLFHLLAGRSPEQHGTSPLERKDKLVNSSN